MKMIPNYSTKLFTEIWPDVTTFKDDFGDSPFAGCIDDTEILYYLLYAKYGNNPIANRDETQWKYKVYSIIYNYGPTWERKLAIQKDLRDLEESELLRGTKAIYNTALNPSTEPSTGTLDELEYINSQNTTNYKRNKLEAYSDLVSLLRDDITDDFLNRFKVCFKTIVSNERPILFVEDDDDE